jgi:hypothetical protein
VTAFVIPAILGETDPVDDRYCQMRQQAELNNETSPTLAAGRGGGAMIGHPARQARTGCVGAH